MITIFYSKRVLSCTVIFEISTFQIANTFQDGNGNGDFLGKLIRNDFQDGDRESIEMKGDCGRQDGNGNGT